MDFARLIRRNVPTIQKSSITSRVPPDILKSARHVIAAEVKRLPGSEDHGLKAAKLGEGGYNEVFLISLVSLLQSWKSSLALTARQKDCERGSQSGEAERTEMEVKMLVDGDPQVVGRARMEI